jgi:methylthioribulose-1-phosphate dehydratase
MSMSPYTQQEQDRAYSELREVKSLFASRGWFPGTSGNLSIRVGDFSPDRERFAFAVTASGKDKTIHSSEDFLLVDEKGRAIDHVPMKPSAETLIHCEIYRLTGAGAIFHVHTVFNNIVSELFEERGTVPVKGVELIKAFNIWEQDAGIDIPILPNYAEIPRIAELVESMLIPRVPGFLIHKHGVCAWGANAFEAKKHLEAFEFLFEYIYRRALLFGK